MSRMMPARVRSEGIELYKKGLLSEPDISEFKLASDVDGEQVVYDLDGSNDVCTCSAFLSNHRYCKHIAAVEEYLKHRAAPEADANLDEIAAAEEMRSYDKENLDFLKSITGDAPLAPMTEQYSLEVLIEDNSQLYDVFSLNYFLYFDLRLYSDELGRSYVIKDIPYFLSHLRNAEPYALGTINYAQLSLENFDETSQDFLNFLFKIDEKTDENTSKSLYLKAGRYLNLPYLFLEEGVDLAQNLARFTIKIGERSLNMVQFIDLDHDSELFHFPVTSNRDYIELKLQASDYQTYYNGALLYEQGIFYKVNQDQRHLIKLIDHQLMIKNTLKFSYANKDHLAASLQQLSTIGQVSAPKYFIIQPFTPHFSFGKNGSAELTFSVKFDYGDFQISSFHDLETLDFARDLRLEEKIFALMAKFGFKKSFDLQTQEVTSLTHYFFIEALPAFKRLGKVDLAPELADLQIDDLPEVMIDRRGGLLDISFDLPNIAENEFSEVINKLQQNADYYISEDGRIFRFGAQFSGLREALKELDDNFTIQGTSLQVSISRSFQVSKIFENIDGSNFSEQFTAFYNDLVHPEHYPYDKPDHIKAQLRSYQETGVRWMSMLTHYSLGGILADDMGLGKTIQAITYLLSNLTEGQTALVTAPASLIYNWASEFDKFTDTIDYVVVDGAKADRTELIAAEHQIYITSYGSFLKDAPDYQAKSLNYLLLDEAQVVKNYSSKTNKALAALNVEHSFALSGTPLENRLEEIWAIFQVVMPGFLPKREKFNKMQASAISRMIQPFVMRRKKEEVLSELPDKMEITLYNELEEEQKVIYLAQLELMQRQLSEMDSRALSHSRIQILAGITRLRQICDTPALFVEGYTGGSGKLERLMELLEQVKESGHRPLIFSQFTKLFPFIEQGMEDLGLSSYKLTGSTPVRDRLSMVQAFNAGSRDAFLISLQAGGIGLNLTSADVVILVDLWWNPAVEEQAIARAHRMGQKNTVEVIRLTTRGTIEEKIIEIQERKKDLISNVLDGDNVEKTLSEAEIREILGL